MEGVTNSTGTTNWPMNLLDRNIQKYYSMLATQPRHMLELADGYVDSYASLVSGRYESSLEHQFCSLVTPFCLDLVTFHHFLILSNYHQVSSSPVPNS